MSATLVLESLPPDPLLGLMAKFREDRRSTKIDLGVGVYRDDHGVTPIMAAVHEAQAMVHSTEQSKAYEGPRGNLGFCEAIERLVFGDLLTDLKDRLTSLATPGGCGALYLGIQVSKRATRQPDVWISDPSWPNHNHLARTAGLLVKSYRYLNQGGDGIDFDALLEDLKLVRAGDIVILQGPCHNPSGIDLSQDQWLEISKLAQATRFIPIIDIAYHGLGTSLAEDMSGVRSALRLLPEAIITYSCSKNFGLYRERVGCVLFLAQTPELSNAGGTHLADISRACYSMPPSHGAAIVDAILDDPDLTKKWKGELGSMRQRIAIMRRELADALNDAFQDDRFERIASESGMFSLMPIDPDQAEVLAATHGIYVPGSGRINVAGMTSGTARVIANGFKAVLI